MRSDHNRHTEQNTQVAIRAWSHTCMSSRFYRQACDFTSQRDRCVCEVREATEAILLVGWNGSHASDRFGSTLATSLDRDKGDIAGRRVRQIASDDDGHNLIGKCLFAGLCSV